MKMAVVVLCLNQTPQALTMAAAVTTTTTTNGDTVALSRTLPATLVV